VVKGLNGNPWHCAGEEESIIVQRNVADIVAD